MAGFVVPSPTLVLVFEQYDGLEVRAGSIPLGQLLELEEGAGILRSGGGGGDGRARAIFEEFAKNLRGWNCEYSEGSPVPADFPGLCSLDARFASDIILAWFDAISGGDLDKGPLGRPSPNGSPSAPAPFVPTEQL